VEFTLANQTTIQVPKYVPLKISFTQPGVFDNGENKVINLALEGRVLSITAVGVPRGWTVALDLSTKGSENITVTAPAASYSYYAATGTATLLVSDGNTQTITKELTLECSAAYAPPPAPGIEFEQPVEFGNGEQHDVSLTEVTATVKDITAVDVPRGWTVAPDLAGQKITVTAPANDGKRYTATGTVTLLVSDGAKQTITKSLILSCPAYVAPAKLGIEFTQPEYLFHVGYPVQLVDFTTTGNVSSVKVLDVPKDWRITVDKWDGGGQLGITCFNNVDDKTFEAFVFASDAAGNTVMRTLVLRAMGTTLCTQCCHNGAGWVDCYVTTNPVSTAAEWSGNGNNFYPYASDAYPRGTSADSDGRYNTSAITSTGASAVQLCKDFNTGWYLPAYEELVNMSSATQSSGDAKKPQNGLAGANILKSGTHWSSTELYRSNIRNTLSTDNNDMSVAVGVQADGSIVSSGNKMEKRLVRCVFRFD
jgi:hypothetical protein